MGLAHMRIKWRIHHQKLLAHESHQLHRLPHGKISLTRDDVSGLNPVLSISNEVRLETAGNQFDGRLFEFVQGNKVFLLYFLMCMFEMKSPLSIQKFNLIQRRLDTKFENSKPRRVRCKNLSRFKKSLSMSDIVRCIFNALIDSLYRFLSLLAVSLVDTPLILALSSLVLYIVTDLSTFCALIRFKVIIAIIKA